MLHFQSYDLLFQKAFLHIHVDCLGEKDVQMKKNKGNVILQIDYLLNLQQA